MFYQQVYFDKKMNKEQEWIEVEWKSENNQSFKFDTS